MPRLHSARSSYFFFAYAALGLTLTGGAAWVGHSLGASPPLWVFALGCALGLFGLAAVWLEPIVDDPRKHDARRLPHSPKRWRRLLKGLEFLPQPQPEGWTGPHFAPGTSGWVYFAGDVVVVSYALEDEAGYRLWVELASRDRATRLADSRATEVLSQFRGVGPFSESTGSPVILAKLLPYARKWTARPCEVTASWPVPPETREPLERPISECLAAARTHLPAQLPLGWSAPVAVIEANSQTSQEAWMISDDDLVFLVKLATSFRRARLAVTLYSRDTTLVDHARACEVLRHFRGIREFVQSHISDELTGARTYLGKIEAHASSVQPN